MSVKVNDGISNISVTSDNFDSAFSNSLILSYSEFHCVGQEFFDEWLIIRRYVSFASHPHLLVLCQEVEHFNMADSYILFYSQDVLRQFYLSL